METLINISTALLVPVYCAALAAYGVSLFGSGRGKEIAERWTRPALYASILVHAILIYAETAFYGHCLVYSPFELMTMIAFMVTLVYLIVELVTKERGTGVFFVGIALIFQILSGMFSPETNDVAGTGLLENGVGLHITAAIFGYTAFTMSAVWGILYLMQHHEIRANRFGLLYNRLPSLGLLERMIAIAVIVGLLFLSIAIVIAVLWLPDILPAFTYHDPKVVATFIVWVLYALALLVRYGFRVDQRRFVLLSLCGFGGMIVSMTIINILSRFHDFS